MATSVIAQSTLVLPSHASPNELRRASIWLAECGQKFGIPTEQHERLDLSLNEALANVIEHGGEAAQTSSIRLALDIAYVSGGYEATVTVSDSGPAFDPLAFVPKKASSLDEAGIGGLGIVLIRNSSDEVRYRFQNNQNHLAFTVRWEHFANEAQDTSGKPKQGIGREDERRKQNIKPPVEQRQGERRHSGLEWIALFGGIDEEAINAIIAKCEVVALAPGDILLQPDVPNDNIFMVLAGKLAAYLDIKSSPDTFIPIERGQCIGELSAIDGKPVTAHIVAQNNVRLLKLTQELFWEQLMVIPGVARNMLMAITQRMRSATDQILEHQRKQMQMQQLQKELKMARELQASMLPLQRPMFPDRKEIDLAASMEPASEVGGDLFDAFFVDDHHLFISIGDVSGHGIPAAMFMARVIGLLRFIAMTTSKPEELIEQINDQLCKGNESSQFVTLFCGFLNVTSGRFVYSNGGHCAPILLRDGQASRLPIPKGPLVGAIPEASYSAAEMKFDPGDTLVCFTDGITEAQSASGEEFSEERLAGILHKAACLPLESVITEVRRAVMDFIDNRELEDDHTMLSLRWCPPL